MAIWSLRHRFELNQHGAVAIEFAVIVLLLLLILFGILEFSFTFLQRHFVANAAREGVRLGIRAQNYNCFDIDDPSLSCKNAQNQGNDIYRKQSVIDQLSNCTISPKGYLCTLYQSNMALVDVTKSVGSDGETKILTVTVEAPNFFPPLLSGLVPGYQPAETIKYSAIGHYENADEN